MFSCLDTAIVSTALVSISDDLNDYLNAPWTVLAYLLTYMSQSNIIIVLEEAVTRRG
jgi:hypothetical protein